MCDDAVDRLEELSTRQVVLQKSLDRTRNEIKLLQDVVSRVASSLDDANLRLEELSKDFPEESEIESGIDSDPELEGIVVKPDVSRIPVRDYSRIVSVENSSGVSSCESSELDDSSEGSWVPVLPRREHNPRAVEYRLLDLEARSRRHNLMFYGIPEPYRESLEQCDMTLRRFLANKLGVPDPYRIELNRVRRIGRRDTAERLQRIRPIIATFKNDQLKSGILNHGFMLKNTHYGIAQDYPDAIRRARKELLQDYRNARARGRRAQIKYPAKLLVDGRVVQDLFPGWQFDEI